MNQVPPPPPTNVRWHRFANSVIEGTYLVEAYLEAGFTCAKTSAYVLASRLRRKPEVDVYIEYWAARKSEQQQQALLENLGIR
jgi:phage terminase small subunit